jgi:hypothetical protein
MVVRECGGGGSLPHGRWDAESEEETEEQV